MKHFSKLIGKQGNISPFSARTSLSFLTTTPGSKVTVRLSVSISRMRLSRSVARTMPPQTGTAPPASPVPPPRTVTGKRWRSASVTICLISSSVSGKTTASGRRVCPAPPETSSCPNGSRRTGSPDMNRSGPTIAASSARSASSIKSSPMRPLYLRAGRQYVLSRPKCGSGFP